MGADEVDNGEPTRNDEDGDDPKAASSKQEPHGCLSCWSTATIFKLNCTGHRVAFAVTGVCLGLELVLAASEREERF